MPKPSGGVRGVVAGDILRRIVGRTIAQQISAAVESATAPFQCAMSTRAGTEYVAHALQALTELGERSVEGANAVQIPHCGTQAFDTICVTFRRV